MQPWRLQDEKELRLGRSSDSVLAWHIPETSLNPEPGAWRGGAAPRLQGAGSYIHLSSFSGSQCNSRSAYSAVFLPDQTLVSANFWFFLAHIAHASPSNSGQSLFSEPTQNLFSVLINDFSWSECHKIEWHPCCLRYDRYDRWSLPARMFLGRLTEEEQQKVSVNRSTELWITR